MRSAAIVTVGSELVTGVRVDTNTAEIARALGSRGFTVVEAVSVGDDAALLAGVLRRLSAECELVVVTGGLGPTHDDVTREGASVGLGLALVRDPRIESLLAPAVRRHEDPAAAALVLVQADVLEGAVVIDPTTGTAPGQVIATGGGHLALLPGPPSEMRPMLAQLVARYESPYAQHRELGVVGLGESDVQVRVQRAIDGIEGLDFTVLASPGDVRALLFDRGIGEAGLSTAATRAASELGEHCYTTEGETLAQVVVRTARETGLTLGTAESCTGGMVSAAITDVPGASACFLGGVVSYRDDVKAALLGAPEHDLAMHGAVSEQVARAMATGASSRIGCDVAVSVTGIAGPDGGSAEKPVGLVWFAVSGPGKATVAVRRVFASRSRAAIRARATATALDLMRRAMLGLPLD